MAKGLASLFKEVLDDTERTRDNLVLSFHKTLYDIGDTLVFYTPIKTGLASSNWNLTNGPQSEGVRLPEEGVKGKASLDAIVLQVKSTNIGEIITYYNPVEYIDLLEDGSSRQAPSGMITPTISQVESLWSDNLKEFGIIR